MVNLLAALSLGLPVPQLLDHFVLVLDRKFDAYRQKEIKLSDVRSEGPEAWCGHNGCRYVGFKGHSAIAVPSDFAGLDHYERSAALLSAWAKGKTTASLDELSPEARKALESTLEWTLGYRPEPLGKETFSLTYDTTADFSVGDRTVSLRACADKDLRAKTEAARENPIQPRKSPLNFPTQDKALKRTGVLPTLEVRVSSDGPLFTAERLKLSAEAIQTVAGYLEDRMAANQKAVHAALVAAGYSDAEALGGDGPVRGDKGSIPKTTLERMHSDFMSSWRANGFPSEESARSFWSQATVSGSHANAYLVFGETGGQANLVLLGRD